MTLLLDRPLAVGPDSADLLSIVGRHAADEDSARRLAARVLLHLPRLADDHGELSVPAAEREIGRLAADEAPPPRWLLPPARPPSSPIELSLSTLDSERARVLHERFHYLRSHRAGLHLAGTFDGHVAVLLTFAPLDLDALDAALPAGVERETVLVLARAYSAAWAPRNSLSRILALASSELRRREPRPRLLLTYLNPGIGFDGASYKAANWRLLGREHGTRYAYLDGWYVTDRELAHRFGTSDVASLERLLGDRIAISRMPLDPLDLYAFALDSRAHKALAAASPREWSRPWA